MTDKRPTHEPLTATVRKLRIALNDTQQAFAQRLGMAIATVVRYEHNRPPKAKALATLERVATENGLEEYAAIFRAALAADLGSATGAGSGDQYDAWSAADRDLADAFRMALHDPRFKSKAEKIRSILAPVIAEARKNREFFAAIEDSKRAVVRLLTAGESVEAVAQKFTPEHLAEALFQFGGVQLIEKHEADVVGLLLKKGWSIDQLVQEYNFEPDTVIGHAVQAEQFQAIQDYEERHGGKGE